MEIKHITIPASNGGLYNEIGPQTAEKLNARVPKHKTP